MIWYRVIVFVIFCILKSKTDTPTELDYYYLDTVGTQSKEIIPQDGQDAQAIIDSKKDPQVIAKILLQRDKIRRININTEITNKDKNNPLVPEKYSVQNTPLNDLYYTLTRDENTVLSAYLRHFFWFTCDEPWVAIAFTLTKDMKTMRETYDNIYGKHDFKEARKYQRQTFEHMLRVWVRENREPNEKEELKPDMIKKDVDALIEEYKKGGWHENRDQIELILMKKSIKYSREVIKGFEKAYENCPMEQIINDSKFTNNLHWALANSYSTLARYIKNRYQYMADLLREYRDGQDCWGIWMLCVAVTFPEEWIQIDQCFRNSGNKDISLSKFITEKMKLPGQKMFVSMVSQIVDVTNKGPPKPPGPAPAPQPSPPTSQPPTG